MMEEFFLHRDNSGKLLLLRDKQDKFVCLKRKYVGRKAKVEAIKRFTGGKVRLNSTMRTEEINKYIKENIFGTSSWAKYHEIFTHVAGEREKSERPVAFMATVFINNISNLEEKELRERAIDYIRYKELYNSTLINIVL